MEYGDIALGLICGCYAKVEISTQEIKLIQDSLIEFLILNSTDCLLLKCLSFDILKGYRFCSILLQKLRSVLLKCISFHMVLLIVLNEVENLVF